MDNLEQLTQTPEVIDQPILQKGIENIKAVGSSVLEGMPVVVPLLIGAGVLALTTGVAEGTAKSDQSSRPQFDNPENTNPAVFLPHTPKEVRHLCPYYGTFYGKYTGIHYNEARTRAKVKLKTFSIEVCDGVGIRKITIFTQLKNSRDGEFNKNSSTARWKTNKEKVLRGDIRTHIPRCTEDNTPLLYRRVSRVTWLPKSGKKSQRNSKLYIGRTRRVPC